jgi:peptide/nickel transport system ATP-binding protein/oligopeptide transport system ATP-binding protein
MTDATDPALLTVRDLHVHFPVRGALPWITLAIVRAVDGVDLDLARGETLGVVGESGCGKTTLGAAILGLQAFNSGAITFNGRQLAANAAVEDRDGMQVIFQDPFTSLNPKRRVWKSVGEPMLVRGASKHSTRERVAELFDAVGLQRSHLDRFAHQFSGGQRQRLAIARSLVLRPQLIICDEPVSALDVSVQSQVLNLLNQLQSDFGLAYLFISHDLTVVKNVSDRIAVIYLGKIVESATADRLFTAPAHPYTRALLDAVPRLSALDANRPRQLLQGETPSPTQTFRGCPFRSRCPIAVDRCETTPPPLVDMARGHAARCHRAGDAAGI